jgi:hypothetical protein
MTIQSIKKGCMMLILVTVFASCDQGKTLQRYYVDNQEKADFLSVDVPVSMLNLEEATLTEDQLKAYNSIDKLNMLAFRKTAANDSTFTEELAQVKTILKDPKYEELMRGGNTVEGKFIIKYLGEDDSIDELIVFGDISDKGFVIVRVLGTNMNPGEILKLESVLENIDSQHTDLKQFTDFFK